MIKKASESTFPTGLTVDGISSVSGGITKFEYFTAIAMQGLLAHGHIADIELRAVACAKKVLSEIQKTEFNEG